MKKIAVLLVALTVFAVAEAQVVVGLQGGYYDQTTTETINLTEVTTKNNFWIGGLEVGYMITPKLYVGVSGHYFNSTHDSTLNVDNMLIQVGSHEGQVMPVEDHKFRQTRPGWSISPTVKYEIVKYGNMHFHLQLQGTIRQDGYTRSQEQYYKPWENGGEMEHLGAAPNLDYDSISNHSWSVSLRPTLSYDFSTHLSAELSLDFLSVGYVSATTNYDAQYQKDPATGAVLTAPKHEYKVNTLYAGLNTLMETLHWESPMLRLGFNYTF